MSVRAVRVYTGRGIKPQKSKGQRGSVKQGMETGESLFDLPDSDTARQILREESQGRRVYAGVVYDRTQPPWRTPA